MSARARPGALVNRPCPCGSGRKYKRCCRAWHQGAPAPDPEALMRSRYAAYCLGLVDYLIETTDPDGEAWGGPVERWRGELETSCRDTEYTGLEVLEAGADEDVGWVRFRARYRVPHGERAFHERSEFRRVEGRWLYHAGEVQPG